MILKELVADWLKTHGYDGLYHENPECACLCEELMPCDEPGTSCRPGIKVPCDGSLENCPCPWHIEAREELKEELKK